MATVRPTVTRNERRNTIATWSNVTSADSTLGADVSDMRDINVQISGTPAGTAFNPEGSVDNAAWFPLTEDGATPITLTAVNQGAKIFEKPQFLRWAVIGGAAVGMTLRAFGSNRLG